MDKIVFFHYQYKNTIIHNLDSRIKILIMLVLSISINLLNSNIYSYSVVFAYVLFMIIVSKLPILTLLKNLRMFLMIIIFILFFNAIKISSIHDIQFSYDGFIQGLLFSSKLLLILSLTTAITSTFSLIAFRDTIEWYLSFIKFINAKRIAMMINMTFIFIPIIFDKYIEIRNAQISRCIDARKKPIQKIVLITVALLNSVIRQSDEIAFAMEARNYNEEASNISFDKPKASDFVMLICSILVVTIALYISYIF